jgi:hypothetical protein
MKLVCRKCNIEFPLQSFEEIQEVQLMTCGGGGTHRLVGRE